jgi:hypothetical protein
MMPTPFAFRVLGVVSNARQLVDYGAAFAAYCHADPAARPEIPAYLSAFTYPAEFRRHLESTGLTRDYRGPVGVPSVKWDIDWDNLAADLRDARRLASFMVDRYRLDADDLLTGFSGSKGFHVELPVGWTVEPSPDANMTCRVFAERAANEIGVVIDSGVYDKVRPFRAWNTRHPKTGLHKIRIDLHDLLLSSMESITRRAVGPIPFDPPSPVLSASFATDWEMEARVARRQVEKRPPRQAGPNNAGSLNALTRQLIDEPAAVEVGDRTDGCSARRRTWQNSGRSMT